MKSTASTPKVAATAAANPECGADEPCPAGVPCPDSTTAPNLNSDRPVFVVGIDHVTDAEAAAALVPTPKDAPRPVTCSAYSAVHADKADGRSATCKRLPMHKGECRATLTASASRKAERAAAAKTTGKVARKTSKRVTAAQRKRDAYADIAERMAAGTLTPGDAMAEVAKLA